MFENAKLFAFDLDGTIYLGDQLMPGADELIEGIREKYQVVFFTNNSSKARQEVYEKLNRLEIQCSLDEIYTSSFATALYLKESGIDNVYVVGSDGLRQEIADQGIRICDDQEAQHLVVGMDLSFDYDKITKALAVLSRNGKFIACNEDGSFPVEGNRFLPGCGAMVGAIAAASNMRPDFVVGKPNTYVIEKIAGDYDAAAHEIVVVGDTYDSDIAMALNFGSNSVLINSDQNVSNKSVLVLKNLNELFKFLWRDV